MLVSPSSSHSPTHSHFLAFRSLHFRLISHLTLSSDLQYIDTRGDTARHRKQLGIARSCPSANQRPGIELPAATDVMFWYQPEAASASFPSSFSHEARTMRWPLPSIPYPPAKAGFWSPVTSTLNWCEEVSVQPRPALEGPGKADVRQDYYATPYSAEVVNAMTNLLFMWLGIKGILSCRRNQHDQIFLVAFCGYLVVGTGSFLFHSTLKCKLP